MAAMFTIAIASSLVAISGLIGSAHAFMAKKQIQQWYRSINSFGLPSLKMQMLKKQQA
jgi:hypothetical protein